MSWWSDVVKWAWNQPTVGQEAGVQPGTTAPATAAVSAAGGFDGLSKTITAVYAGVADGKFWRSLGWLLLGIILMFLGVLWWIGPSASRAGPGELATGIATRVTT
jgi:hypothetical protein